MADVRLFLPLCGYMVRVRPVRYRGTVAVPVYRTDRGHVPYPYRTDRSHVPYLYHTGTRTRTKIRTNRPVPVQTPKEDSFLRAPPPKPNRKHGFHSFPN